MRNTILLTIIGLLFPILTDAQSNPINQDSITFHQSFITDNSLDDIKPQLLKSSATSEVGSFTVAGNLNTYYPVAFTDNGWTYNEATILEIGRSNAHGNSLWNGSLISTFKFHVIKWGHGSIFVDANIKEHAPLNKSFIGGGRI